MGPQGADGRGEGMEGYGLVEERALLSFCCCLIGQGAGQKQGLGPERRRGLGAEAQGDWLKNRLSGAWSQESSSLGEWEEIA